MRSPRWPWIPAFAGKTIKGWDSIRSDSALASAIALDMEYPRRVPAEDRLTLGACQRGRVDQGARVRVADAEREVAAEHYLVGAGEVGEIAQRQRLEHHGVEEQPPESLGRVRVFARVDRVVALEPPKRPRHRAAGMRQD